MLKRFLVYNYSPENVKAQIKLADFLDEGINGVAAQTTEHEDGTGVAPLDDLFKSCVNDLKEDMQLKKRPTTTNLVFARSLSKNLIDGNKQHSFSVMRTKQRSRLSTVREVNRKSFDDEDQ